jgi:hypothetical protein
MPGIEVVVCAREKHGRTQVSTVSTIIFRMFLLVAIMLQPLLLEKLFNKTRFLAGFKNDLNKRGTASL